MFLITNKQRVGINRCNVMLYISDSVLHVDVVMAERLLNLGCVFYYEHETPDSVLDSVISYYVAKHKDERIVLQMRSGYGNGIVDFWRGQGVNICCM